jgi:hypothetical protein
VAIEHALTILAWHENYPSEEVPPEYLWEDPEGLDMWFKKIMAQRELEMSGEGVPSNFEANDEPLGDNELARALRG